MGKSILSKQDNKIMKRAPDNMLGLPASTVSKYFGTVDNIAYPTSGTTTLSLPQTALQTAKNNWAWILIIIGVIILLYLVYTKKIKF